MSISESKKQSFYDVVLAIRSKADVFTRIVYALVLPQQFAGTSFFPHIQRFNQAAFRQTKKHIFGRVINHQTFLLAFLQSTCQAINFHMSLICQSFQSGVITAGSVVVQSDENPNQIFKSLKCQGVGAWNVQLGKTQYGPVEESPLVWEKYSNMLKFANTTNFQRDVKLSQDDAQQFMSGRYMNLGEYKQIYLQEITFDLENQTLFPQPHSLVKSIEYNETHRLGFL